MALASLPMYDLPEVAWATEAWWAGLARAMRAQSVPDVPDSLTGGVEPYSLWRDPDLLFSQTCGYPLTHGLAGAVRVIATPAYTATGCDGPNYCSVFVARRDDPRDKIADFRGAVAAVNSRDSQSGYSALRAAVAPHSTGGRFFGQVRQSGGHAKSLALVASREADICAVDCVTFGLLQRHRPEAVEGLRTVGTSASAPGLPYVTRGGADEDLLEKLRAAVTAAVADPALAEARAALLIAGAEVLPDEAYERILEIERNAERLGYPQLA
jgi:ABC-type phosphate/phosphonate transport system substrate-binding protein